MTLGIYIGMGNALHAGIQEEPLLGGGSNSRCIGYDYAMIA